MKTTPTLMTRDAAGNGTAKVAARMNELRAAQKAEPFRREAEVGHIDVEARIVELSFSSEVEYERWWGIEILGHDAHEVDLSRLSNKAAVLWMHNWDDQRGVVESVRIDGDRKGRAVVRFSKSEAGEQLFQDIVDGIVTKVSVGYTIEGIKLVEERENMDVYRVTAWTPFEISMVSVPADDTVGVGRGAEKPQEEAPQKQAETSTSIKDSAATRATIEDQTNMKFRTFRDAQGNLCRVAVNESGEDVGQPEIIEAAGREHAAGATTERTRAAEILALGDQYAGSIPTARELAAAAVRDGHSRAQFQDALLAAFNQRAAQPLSEQNANADVGMSDAEVRRYSFLNVIRALANPNDTRAQKAAAFEIECGRAAEKTLGRTAQGILVPPDVLSRAAMSTTQSDLGSTLVQTDVMRGSFIDLLRNRTVVMQLATVISGLVGNVDIPKQLADGQAYWVGEGGDAQETGFKLGQISFNPKTLGAFTEITRRLLNQTSAGVEGMVRADLIRAIAQAIDLAGWYGTGTEYQPLGLKNQSGINAVPFATAGQPTFAELVQMETEVAADNADIGSMAYVGNARFRGHAKTAVKFASAGSATIWEPGNTVNGYRTEITNQVANNDVFFGNFADFVIGLWGGLDLTVDPFSLSKSGGVRIVAFQDVDMGLRRKESICVGG
jgi:HK97 family phage major capsid protein/HK97 family phage prohead protease